jgi:hypothetical protein
MTIRDRLRALAREPFLHFLLIGAAIFGLNALRGGSLDPNDRRIVINEAQVSRLVSGWIQTWGRTPTDAEVDGLIREQVKEEIYYREALRLGLDKDDTVIRRRLHSKMEFLAVSQLENERPDAATLQTWLDQHRASYAKDPLYSFDQIYLGQAASAQAAQGLADKALARLKAGEDWSRLGQPLNVPASQERTPASDISRQFAGNIAEQLRSAPKGQWSGPVESGFGWHLVQLRKAEAAEAPKLSEVRQQVENDWRTATLAAREQAAYQGLLNAYDVRIEKPR